MSVELWKVDDGSFGVGKVLNASLGFLYSPNRFSPNHLLGQPPLNRKLTTTRILPSQIRITHANVREYDARFSEYRQQSPKSEYNGVGLLRTSKFDEDEVDVYRPWQRSTSPATNPATTSILKATKRIRHRAKIHIHSIVTSLDPSLKFYEYHHVKKWW